MTMIYEERPSDSPYIESVTYGQTLSQGSTIRPGEIHWHMVFVKVNGQTLPLVVGPLETSGIASWGGDAEILWIKFGLGTFMPHLPARNFLNAETSLPGAASNSFWLKGSAWQFPDYENADTFVNRMVRDELLVRDSIVESALQGRSETIAPRTVRHRFLQATGLTQKHISQFERARQAEVLLQQGVSILDVVYQLGYFDQPHLTRSLKHFIGHTPAQLLRASPPA